MSNREIVQAILDAAYKAHGDEIFVSDGYAYCENVLTAFVKELNKRDEQIAALTLERDKLALRDAHMTLERDGLQKMLAASEAAAAQLREALKPFSDCYLDSQDRLPKGAAFQIQSSHGRENGSLILLITAFKAARQSFDLPNGQPLLDKLARYRKALLFLVTEAKGFLSQANVDDHGVTNIRCLELVIRKAEEALKDPSEDRDGEE